MTRMSCVHFLMVQPGVMPCAGGDVANGDSGEGDDHPSNSSDAGDSIAGGSSTSSEGGSPVPMSSPMRSVLNYN